jgi:hypothetical protein
VTSLSSTRSGLQPPSKKLVTDYVGNKLQLICVSQKISHYTPKIATIPTQRISAVRSATDFGKLAAEATSEAPADDEEDVDEVSPDSSDEEPADELEEPVCDDEVGSAVDAITTMTSPSLAVETSLPDFVSDALGEVVELASAAAKTPAIPAHT